MRINVYTNFHSLEFMGEGSNPSSPNLGANGLWTPSSAGSLLSNIEEGEDTPFAAAIGVSTAGAPMTGITGIICGSLVSIGNPFATTSVSAMTIRFGIVLQNRRKKQIN